jgi:hypothetical protein
MEKDSTAAKTKQDTVTQKSVPEKKEAQLLAASTNFSQ